MVIDDDEEEANIQQQFVDLLHNQECDLGVMLESNDVIDNSMEIASTIQDLLSNKRPRLQDTNTALEQKQAQFQHVQDQLLQHQHQASMHTASILQIEKKMQNLHDANAALDEAVSFAQQDRKQKQRENTHRLIKLHNELQNKTQEACVAELNEKELLAACQTANAEVTQVQAHSQKLQGLTSACNTFLESEAWKEKIEHAMSYVCPIPTMVSATTTFEELKNKSHTDMISYGMQQGAIGTFIQFQSW